MSSTCIVYLFDKACVSLDILVHCHVKCRLLQLLLTGDVLMIDAVHVKVFFSHNSYIEVKHIQMRDLGDNPHFPSDLVTGDREADLERLITESKLFMAVSHIFWSCWALLNGVNPPVQFDYNSYARDRLALYFQLKPSLQAFMNNCQ
ncbi:unnamed protein product [Strongylus vulgaris]|uniref:Uncharacterized protein n=1 Tax=Strongylus vulgaris TaxID=40348 RepID=A0A3P7J8A4_STRVU|nr:unnamed protein product [Strongylus vulgaris]